MIAADRATAALRAVHATLLARRALAEERVLDGEVGGGEVGGGEAVLARYLDEAEYLPGLMLDAADATGRFEDHLRAWACEDRVGLAALNAYLRELRQPQVDPETIDRLPRNRVRASPGFDPTEPDSVLWDRVEPDGTRVPASAAEVNGLADRRAALLTPGLPRAADDGPRLHQDAA